MFCFSGIIFILVKLTKYSLILRINWFTVNVRNVSLIPSDNPLAIKEGTQREVRCVVNSNAVPAPTITWYLGSTNITYVAGTDTTFITLTGTRTDNMKTLQCRAINNNKSPKTASTTLNVECKFSEIPSEYSYKKFNVLSVFKILRWIMKVKLG